MHIRLNGNSVIESVSREMVSFYVANGLAVDVFDDKGNIIDKWTVEL